MMTKEYILKKNLATEEDLKNIDVEKMIKDAHWHKGDELKHNISHMIAVRGKRYRTDIPRLDYSRFLESDVSTKPITKDDMTSVKTVSFSYNENGYSNVIIYDFSTMKGYSVDNWHRKVFQKGFYEPKEFINLSLEDVKELHSYLLDSKLWTWNREYKGENDPNILAYTWWNVFYELEDGRIYINSGSGLKNQHAPAEKNILKRNLRDFWGGKFDD